MKIAVDARELRGRPTGVGRYLGELLACWSRQPDAAAHELILMAPEPLALPEGLAGRGGARIVTQVVPGSGRLWWEQRTFPAAAARADAQVAFCPGYSGPLLARMPVVVSIHDVSFWAHPEWFRWKEGLRRRTTTWAVARRARLVLTLTRFSRDEIIRWMGTDAERVRVINPGVGGFFDPMGEMTSPPPPASPPIVLTVGSIFNRRHVDVLIRAFARVVPRIPGARLVVVGENRTHPYQDLEALARELGVGAQVEMRSYVSDDELRSLYARAGAFAFLSTYEGFGLTPLEAVAAGVPTVVYDSEVAREVHADLAQRVPVGDVEALAAALAGMLNAPPDRAQRAVLASEARARYPWTRTAEATLAALVEAARP